MEAKMSRQVGSVFNTEMSALAMNRSSFNCVVKAVLESQQHGRQLGAAANCSRNGVVWGPDTDKMEQKIIVVEIATECIHLSAITLRPLTGKVNNID